MACRGVFFALTKEEEAKLLAAADSDAVVEIITEEIEERWDREWLVEMDKSWDAVHRCLGDGSLRTSQPSLTARAVLVVNNFPPATTGLFHISPLTRCNRWLWL